MYHTHIYDSYCEMKVQLISFNLIFERICAREKDNEINTKFIDHVSENHNNNSFNTFIFQH